MAHGAAAAWPARGVEAAPSTGIGGGGDGRTLGGGGGEARGGGGGIDTTRSGGGRGAEARRGGGGGGVGTRAGGGGGAETRSAGGGTTASGMGGDSAFAGSAGGDDEGRGGAGRADGATELAGTDGVRTRTELFSFAIDGVTAEGPTAAALAEPTRFSALMRATIQQVPFRCASGEDEPARGDLHVRLWQSQSKRGTSARCARKFRKQIKHPSAAAARTQNEHFCRPEAQPERGRGGQYICHLVQGGVDAGTGAQAPWFGAPSGPRARVVTSLGGETQCRRAATS